MNKNRQEVETEDGGEALKQRKQNGHTFRKGGMRQVLEDSKHPERA